nr:RHS repeat-associated core domain-containing protein [Thermoanaerobaculia bacterium]
ESDSTTTEVYDRQGRLWRVREPSMPDGTELVTQYGYHPANLLASVAYNNVAGSQSRTFSFDGRGFLTSEKHPELGTVGNSTITYSYDAKGHAVRRTEGIVNGSRDLTFEFDRAERLKTVRETPASGTIRRLKEFTYASANAAGNFKQGKLETALRHNWIHLPGATVDNDVTVTETYTYGDAEGRGSARDTVLSSGPAFTQSFAYDALGLPASESYPRCTHSQCSGTGQDFTVSLTRNQGLLTAVSGFATIGYHANGMVNTVAHTNGVTDTYGLDPASLPRPGSIGTSGVLPATNAWSSGSYQYDGAGNVVKIGSDVFLYDAASRLVKGTLASISANTTQEAKFDAWGNLTELKTNGSTQTFAIDPLTNHLSAGATYDVGGNVASWGGLANTFDAFNQLKYQGNHVYAYTVDDQRIYSLDWNTSFANSNELWTLRDLSGQVQREFLSHGNVAGQWSWSKDYLHRDGQLLASVAPAPTGILHYTLDHLGSPRLITDGAKARVALHTYFPFGAEATSPTQDAERMKFTGHERDANGAGTLDDLDYMHARYCSPGLGRFLSVDPVLGDVHRPLSWNRYAYVVNNPMKYVDPTGRAIDPIEWFEGLLEDFLGKEAPPPKADKDDPNMEAAADDSVAGNTNLLPVNEAGLVQQGLNKATAEIGAQVAVVVVTDGVLRLGGKVLEVADLSAAAGAADRNGLTRAGRALQKHASRAGSAFSTTAKRAADLN